MSRELSEKEYESIRDYIHKNYGINLGPEKKTLVYSRLRTVLEEKGLENFTEYFNYLKNDKTGQAAVQFIDKMTTNHTFFMREVDHFDYFRDKVLPYIEQTHSATKDLRLWCAACSSGEEPYTLQMIIQDYFKNKPGWNTDILATDISTNVLSKAVRGVYSNESISTLPAEWQKKYFKKLDGGNSQVIDEIRKKVIFRKFNLMDSNHVFKKPFQVIFCRNVMIYFDAETREEVVKRFYSYTESGGYLFVGHSESLNNTQSGYKYVMAATYCKP